MPNDIAVVILNWNTRKFLQQFLPDVIRFSSGADIIVADNGSTDDSVEYLRKNFPDIRIIINDHNEGFAGGYNIALKQVEAKYFLLLNSDVAVTEGWLEPMKRLIESNDKIAAVQPKIRSFLDPPSFEYAGAAGGFIDRFGYPFCRGRLFLELENDDGQYDDDRPVFWATGACMLVRSTVFEELGGFDTNFFAHMEEIDLCWRIQRSGYQVWYSGRSHVFHVGGGTLAKESPRKTFLNFRNNLLMIFKNTAKNEVFGLFTIRLIMDFVASIKFLLEGNIQNSKAVWEAWTSFRTMKSQYSRPVQKVNKKVNGTGILIYPKSIVLDYYLYRNIKFSALRWLTDTKHHK